MQLNYPQTKIPSKVGLALKADHYQTVLESLPKVGWFEIHSENFFADGGANLKLLEEVRSHYPMSFHGVGLSLGSADGLDSTHVEKLVRLVNRFEPGLVSEHVSWSNVDGQTMNDLLPIPYTQEAVEIISKNISTIQDTLKRQILVENPSTYLAFKHSEITEAEFMAQVAKQSGCGILLDINNLYVSEHNHGTDIDAYFESLPQDAIGEMHLAGHSECHTKNSQKILIDDHGSHVIEPVWQRYQQAIATIGSTPTLIEWDTNIPSFEALYAEGQKAQQYLNKELAA